MKYTTYVLLPPADSAGKFDVRLIIYAEANPKVSVKIYWHAIAVTVHKHCTGAGSR